DWLKQYIDFDYSPKDLADRLTMAGLEVDAVEELFTELSDVKVAKIIEANPHPDADRLQVCQVEVGDEIKTIVCGAPNARAGLITAVALPGCVLPGNFKIKKGKIRGQVSEGMLCSKKELGLAEDAQGIIELQDDLISGTSFCQSMGLNDICIEVDLTPNRPDCASVIGTAREVAGMCGTRIKHPVDFAALPVLTGTDAFSVTVTDDTLCPRYVARRMTGVTVAPSPWWLQKRLLSVGLRPINNVVDATNFVMLEYGQPMHGFDLTKLENKAVVVRPATDGETLTTLDGGERKLDASMLVIADATKPVAVAGVMGGGNSEIDDTTTELLLESACFNAVSVRKTARNLNIGTDASYRFERGVDPELAPIAMQRLVEILEDIAGGTVDAGGIDLATGLKSPAEYTLRVGRTNELLGISLSMDEMRDYLTGIEMTVREIDADTLGVTHPSFRIDIEREADLVEEIARLYGYNEVGTTLPVVPMSFASQDPKRILRKKLADVLIAQSCYEAINYSFVSPLHADYLGLPEDHDWRHNVTLLNPLTEEQSVMRHSLLPGLLENVRRNINHQNGDVRLFETGKVFHPKNKGEQPQEELRIAVVLSGKRYGHATPLYFQQDDTDIFDAKGIAESLLSELRLNQVSEIIGESETVYTGGQYLRFAMDGVEIGTVSHFNTESLRRFGIKQAVYYVDLSLDVLVALTGAPKQFSPLPKYPSVQRDIAMVVANSVATADMVDLIIARKEKDVESVELFDVYEGENVGEGFKSVAISVTYRSEKQTLKEKAVSKTHNRITDAVLSHFDARLREV
ncbi:MAG: phenylalanine--tRNA ligase subunit beta, partial [Spirochaetales bacterium]|nr:phenylalanine--tRNA ligase subunit beta [Spirochaetales bacterium]